MILMSLWQNNVIFLTKQIKSVFLSSHEFELSASLMEWTKMFLFLYFFSFFMPTSCKTFKCSFASVFFSWVHFNIWKFRNKFLKNKMWDHSLSLRSPSWKEKDLNKLFILFLPKSLHRNLQEALCCSSTFFRHCPLSVSTCKLQNRHTTKNEKKIKIIFCIFWKENWYFTEADSGKKEA